MWGAAAHLRLFVRGFELFQPCIHDVAAFPSDDAVGLDLGPGAHFTKVGALISLGQCRRLCWAGNDFN